MINRPSKKVLSTFIIVAALVAATIIAFGRDKASSAINYTNNLLAGDKISLPENQNWQEELGKINPSWVASDASEATSTANTLTDSVSISLMANYLAMKRSGSLDSESAQKLVDQSLDYMNQNSLNFTEISESKLNLIADNGKQTIEAYGEKLGIILKTNKPAPPSTALKIFTETVQNDNVSELNKLDSIIVVYEKVGSELSKMPVPKSFAKAHLDLTNSIYAAGAALREIKKVSDDPLRGLTGISLYQKTSAIFVNAMEAVTAFIKQNDVIYKQGTGGYYLLYGI